MFAITMIYLEWSPLLPPKKEHGGSFIRREKDVLGSWGQELVWLHNCFYVFVPWSSCYFKLHSSPLRLCSPSHLVPARHRNQIDCLVYQLCAMCCRLALSQRTLLQKEESGFSKWRDSFSKASDSVETVSCHQRLPLTLLKSTSFGSPSSFIISQIAF